MTEENMDVIPMFIDISGTRKPFRVPIDFEEDVVNEALDIKMDSVKEETSGSTSSEVTAGNSSMPTECSAQNEFKCTELVNSVACWYKTNTEDRLIRHIRKVHRGENPFQCTMCDYTTYNKALFEEHIRIHQGIKPFKCRFCPYRSVSKKNTKRHEQIHRPDNPLKCPHCDFIGRHERSLRLHLPSHLENIPCDKCDFKAKDADALKVHKRVHMTRKWYRCDTCRTRFSQSRNLDVHKRKMKKCEECDTLLCNKVMIAKHMNSTHGKPVEGALFTCLVCKWSCSSRPRVLLHLIHHPNQPLGEELGDLSVLRQYGIIR